MKSGDANLQTTDHPTGILTNEPIRVRGQPHKLQRLLNSVVSFSSRQVVQLCKDQKILVAR